MKRIIGLVIFIVTFMAFLAACAKENDEPVELTPELTSQPTATIIQSVTPIPTSAPVETVILQPTPDLLPTIELTPEYTMEAVCAAADFVNIRAEASKDSEKIGELVSWERVYVASRENGFSCIVASDGRTGYVSDEYLINVRGEPSVEVPFGEWSLILINPTNLIPEGFSVELADYGNECVDSRIFEVVSQMFDDAKEDGVNLRLVSGYRSYDHQKRLYDKKVQSYIDNGYSVENAEREAATITARPNTSEHQTGLALDIVSDTHRKMDSTFAQSDAYKWLTVNAWRYGFIMRYAADKQEYTNVIYEPWHWRFVGVEAAKELNESGDCLEEYLNVE